MTAEEFQEFCDSVEWHWSKTYERTFPHWYCVREEVGDAKFEEAVKFIREHHIKRFFFKKVFGYYDCGEYTFWTMGNPIERTRIINRALR